MAEEDVTDAPDAAADGASTESTDTGGDTSSSGSWPADAQAEYTRKTQALADERKDWESQRNQQTQQLQQYAQQMQQQQYASQQQQNTTQNQQSNDSMLDQLRKMPYLDGNTAAQLMQRMVNEGINPLNDALKQRDAALAQMYKEQKRLHDQVGQSQGQQAQKDLEARFSDIRKDQGLPDNELVHEMMRDVYYSHEGDTLDQEYPDMLRKRWEGLQKLVRENDRAAAQKAKASPFPSRGGEASPTSGKTGGYQTPEERANALWPMLNPNATE